MIAHLENKLGAIGNEKEGTMLPHALQDGLKELMYNFSEYQYGKYDKQSNEVIMQDVIRLAHTKPFIPRQRTLFEKIAKEKLEVPVTWEVIMTKEGSNKETWENAAKIMLYMALLRNHRNFLDNEVSMDVINHVAAMLSEEQRVLHSKQLPAKAY